MLAVSAPPDRDLSRLNSGKCSRLAAVHRVNPEFLFQIRLPTNQTPDGVDSMQSNARDVEPLPWCSVDSGLQIAGGPMRSRRHLPTPTTIGQPPMCLPPPYGHHSGYCGANGSGLIGYCAAYINTDSCSLKRSPACPSGQKAKQPGYYQCSFMRKYYVDLGRSCAF